MRFHLSMFMMVVFISLAMHGMATAATPARDAAQVVQENAGVRQAGQDLNEDLKACREEARQNPKASKRDRQVCERTARRDFRRDIKRARADAQGEGTAR
ncbi:MAG: hypothetical protein EOO54_11320 [Haliea sp.]|nr:MAG: hypothetical protein EOO54_11320 [Haliea sp.]